MSKLQDRYRNNVEVEEVLLDASNIPQFDRGRLEGKRELPITKRNVYTLGALFFVIVAAFTVQVFSLQIIHGGEYSAIADNNIIDKAIIIAERGVVYDIRGEMIAWNEVDESGEYDFPIRAYTDRSGLGQVLGYVSYPKRTQKVLFSNRLSW